MWKKPRPRKKLNDYYAVLGVSSGAPPKAIQFAFWNAARRLHPDVNLDPNALEQYKEVVEAYQTLKSPNTRADYDAQLIAQHCLFLLGSVEKEHGTAGRSVELGGSGKILSRSITYSGDAGTIITALVYREV